MVGLKKKKKTGGGAVNPLPQTIELGSFCSYNVPSSQSTLLDGLTSHLTRTLLFDVEQENMLFPLGVDLFISLFISSHKLYASYIIFHFMVLPFYGNLVQGEALMEALCGKDIPAKVYVGMRYWHPFTEEAIEQVGAFHMSITLVWFCCLLY